MQYLLLAMLMLALTACGTTQTAGTDAGNSLATAKITANVVLPKSAAKTVGLTSDTVTIIRLKVTGASIPTATKDFTGNTGGTIEVYPGSELIVGAQAINASGVTLFEGFATGVVVVSGTPTTVSIVMNAPVVKATDTPCLACHDNTRDLQGQNLVANYKQSGHYFNNISSADSKFGAKYPGCAGCHGTQHNDLSPAASGRCYECHGTANPNHVTYLGASTKNCGDCHIAHDFKLATAGCIGCHSIAQTAGGTFVNDNNGVRSILPEFNKRSHHILGAAPTNEQCAVCHLEGTVGGAVNPAYHTADNKIHLRNADTDADFVWSGTEHTNMDNFCFSCHDSDGAKSAGIAAIMTGKNFGAPFSATNPFADTLTNGYDQVARAGVVDVKTAFTTTNASHHAVSGQRYTYRFSTLANAKVWAARTGKPVPAASDIAEGHTLPDGTVITAGTYFDPAETMTGDFTLDKVAVGNGSGAFVAGTTGSQYLPKGEGEATLYEASKFVATYIPLGATLNVADNSTLHCGDCHTVGQWKAGSSTNADGSATTAAIGAHGSANEYLLRNSLGTDALHDSLTYVCFNCHVAGLNKGTFYSAGAGFGALHPVQNKNQVLGYATAHAVSAFHIQCLADSANNIGATERLAHSWEADKTQFNDYLPAPGATAALPGGSTEPLITGSDASSGNITGIACTNCHNSALRSGFGGIHGGNNTYTDGLGRTQKSYRFMPGMGNYRYAPPGGWAGSDLSPAPNGAPLVATDGKPMGGCYTNGTADTNPGYSACSHHGTSTAQVVLPDKTKVTYGGGTTGSPTAAEPTVREATAGNALVTRPLKY
jgi:hypothetical protein